MTDCPARLGQVTTETVALYTTVCPVAESASTGAPAPTQPASAAGAESTSTLTIVKSTFTTYVTVQVEHSTYAVVESTVAVVPVPSAPLSSAASLPPYPTGPEKFAPVPTGSGAGVAPSETGEAGGSSTTVPLQYSSGAGKISGSVGMLIAAFAAMIALM